MEKIDYCYHTHTTRCGHAYGSEEEYIQVAINNGLKVIGFTDHVFLPGISQPGMRGDYSLLDDYVNTIKGLKEKYKDQIEVLVGFEAEYLEQFVPYYKELLDSKKIDYLILGQHNYVKDNKIIWYNANGENNEFLHLYITHIIEGMKTGLFSYIAHPDFFTHGLYEWSDEASQAARRLCEASIKYDVPLEFNLGGFRYPYNDNPNRKAKLRYPNMEFWKIVSEYPDVKVFIGPDAHKPETVSIDYEIEYALSKVKEFNLNLQTRIKNH